MKKLSEDDRILKEFLEEHFDFATLKKIGFFSKDIKKYDIHKQAARICQRFGYKTVYEYRAKEIRVHITYADDRPLHVTPEGELKEEPFVTVIKSIYED